MMFVPAVEHDTECLQLGMTQNAYSWPRHGMLTVGHDTEFSQLGTTRNAYS